MRANFSSALGILHALHHISLERVSFFEQLVHTLRIRTSYVGQSLQVSDCPPDRAPCPSGANATVSTLWLSSRIRFLSAPVVFRPVAFFPPAFVFTSPFFGAVFFVANPFLIVTLFLASFFLPAFFIGATFFLAEFHTTAPARADGGGCSRLTLGVPKVELEISLAKNLWLTAASRTPLSQR